MRSTYCCVALCPPIYLAEVESNTEKLVLSAVNTLLTLLPFISHLKHFISVISTMPSRMQTTTPLKPLSQFTRLSPTVLLYTSPNFSLAPTTILLCSWMNAVPKKDRLICQLVHQTLSYHRHYIRNNQHQPITLLIGKQTSF